MGENGAASSRRQVLDAIGSLAALQQVLTALGKDAVAFLAADELPLPYEYRFIELRGLVTEPPADLSDRTLVFLDCGNIDRSPLSVEGALIINVDHHHDNTNFGTINHVDPHSSCTAEMVWDLAHGLQVGPTKSAELHIVVLIRLTTRTDHARQYNPFLSGFHLR